MSSKAAVADTAEPVLRFDFRPIPRAIKPGQAGKALQLAAPPQSIKEAIDRWLDQQL